MQTISAAQQTASYFNEVITKLAEYLGLSTQAGSLVHQWLGLGVLIGAAVLGWLVALFVLRFKVARLVNFSKSTWDDTLLHNGVFRRLAMLVPGLIVYFGINAFLIVDSQMYQVVNNLSIIYIMLGVYFVAQACLSATEQIYKSTRFAKKAPITGFIQVGRLLFTLALIFLLISLLLGKSPIYLLSGLTAIAAVLLLIFRDTILGFVAGIQIAANRMFNTGDWIEMPKYNVDGEILEIGLTVVKVQNWDKTISTLPSYSLITEAIKNWRGMSESGGRRIKRAIYIDLQSLQFANEEDLMRWQKLAILQPYLASKKLLLEEDSKELTNKQLDIINGRKLTNIGTFRAYIKEYLAQHKDINHDMTCMVRQLPPKETGLPLEVYCFSKNQNWVEYEGIQADIFDHILSMMPYFNLRTYQRITNTKQDSELLR
ncbi:mechanosensitive ion channel family protein [Glaciecola sp. XM2]|uniref:mechanosensitive ion channel family protein n=1 Tax=Glaciecola sp. XM2 TaxID=1914931 RepID=UPI001BDF6B7C|nr:mechanosensitive ion channel domain-containing protein [Glaciecola sp. XM2]MBT1451127.1 mechanosensitive ion channel family protein [Glaciecola sp. XM2]